jgi:hypothetical protein
MEGSLGGTLLPIAKNSRRKIVMMQGEVRNLTLSAPTGVTVNGSTTHPTTFNTDGVNANSVISVGDRIFVSGYLTFRFQELGRVTQVETNGIVIGAGIGQTYKDPLIPDSFGSTPNNGEISVATVYDINPDGVVTRVSGHGGGHMGSVPHLILNVGAGRISIYGVDDQTAPPEGQYEDHERINRMGTGLTMEFTFGSEVDLTDSLNLVSAVGSFGFDMAAAGMGVIDPASDVATKATQVDRVAFGACHRVAGNTAIFHISLPYEQEGGAQEEITENTVLKFCVMAIADNGGI